VEFTHEEDLYQQLLGSYPYGILVSPKSKQQLSRIPSAASCRRTMWSLEEVVILMRSRNLLTL